MFDVVIKGGLVFDGRGNAPRRVDVGITGGTIATIAPDLGGAPAARTIDARDKWVTPGFIDLHTHYDAEVEVKPGLAESVRHGVTTCVLGSCSLSMALGSADDLADMFCRVEAIPDALVRPVLRAAKTWTNHKDYLEHLDTLALGPNLAAFAGHSAIRAHVMGTARSVEPGQHPTRDELARMQHLVDDALDCGYLGLSVQTLPWDKMGGTQPYRSRPLPSTFARWSEVRTLARRLRERGAILQGVPNVSTKWNVVLFLLESMGLWRRPLKTTIISMMDARARGGMHILAGKLARLFNRVLGADFRWQALPNVFDLWADGVDLVVFEEFGAGTAALHLEDALERRELLRDPKYRARFRREWTSRFLPRAFHRDFNVSTILGCPDPSVVGKSFAQVGKERGVHAVDAFLDLVVEHGDQLRWFTVMCNENPKSVEWIVKHPDVLIGFSDAGAHLRQMAHYSFPLRMLRLVRDSHSTSPSGSIERAVHRLTGEIASWLGIDAGVLDEGKRADIVVLDPTQLDDRLEQVHEEPFEGFAGDYKRLVRRSDGVIDTVLINGRQAIVNSAPDVALGREKLGRVLRGATGSPSR